MAIYELKPSRETLHGSFSPEYPPVLTIRSGDTVRFETLDAGWGTNAIDENGLQVKFPRTEGAKDTGHALCGPVFIEGAKAGMVLEVQINDIRPGNYGWTSAGGFPHPVNQRLGIADGERLELKWAIDSLKMQATSQYGHQVALKPFMGLMGMPPAEPGIHPTSPPRFCGGNIDCKELVPGTTLFLPIAVDGGLFSCGDGHGVQGDGEVAVPALECPMSLVDLTFRVRDDMSLRMPRAKTPAGFVTFGFHEDVNEAMMTALEEMLDFMGELYGFSRKEALALASLVVDLHISQIVNGVRGVHAILPYGAVR